MTTKADATDAAIELDRIKQKERELSIKLSIAKQILSVLKDG